jgi:hypothetical protein
MNETLISILLRATDLGLKLSFIPPDTLDVKASGPWPREFADTLREHKRELIALLRLPIVMVFSEAVGQTLFFCQDDDTRAALCAAGADPFSVYTEVELKILVEQNRVAPLSVAELRRVHEIKRTFSGRISS